LRLFAACKYFFGKKLILIKEFKKKYKVLLMHIQVSLTWPLLKLKFAST